MPRCALRSWFGLAWRRPCGLVLLLAWCSGMASLWGAQSPGGGTPIDLATAAATVGATTSTSTCHNWKSTPDTPNCIYQCSTEPCGTASCAPGFTSSAGPVNNTNVNGQHQATDAAPSPNPVGGDQCATCGGGGGGAMQDISRSSRLPTWQVARLQRPDVLGTHGSFGPGGFLDLDGSLTFQDGGATVFLPQQHSPIILQQVGATYIDQQFASCRGLQLLDASGQPTTVPASAATAVLTSWEGTTYTFELAPALGAGRLVQRADRNGNAITIQYVYPASASPADPALLWEMASSTDAYGRSTTYAYAPAPISGSYPITRIRTPDGQVTSYQYGQGGIAGLSGVSHPDGSTSSFSTHVDAQTQCQVWSFFDSTSTADQRRQDQYLSLGQFIDPHTGQIIDVAPNRVRMIVNGAGEVVYMSWATLTAQFDQQLYVYEGGHSLFRFTSFLGSPVCVERALAWDIASDPSTWSWTLAQAFRTDAQKCFSATTDGLGRTTVEPVDHNAGTRPTITNPDGSTLTTTYNAFREPLQRVDELGRVTTWTYDAHGNCLTMTVGAGSAAEATTTWTYNVHGQPLSKTDGNGHTTIYGYDAIGQLVRISEPPDVAGGVAAVWSFAYDSAGNHTQTIDPEGRVVTLAYDARNRLTTSTYADGSTETKTYGSGADANLVIATTDRNGNQTQYTYDAAGREISRTIAAQSPVAGSITTAYLPGTDLPTTIVTLGDTTTSAYDYTNRRQTTASFPTLTTTLATAEAIDQAGQRVITTDAYGRRTERAFDLEGRLLRTAEEMVPGALASDEDLVAALPDPSQQPWSFQSLGNPATPGTIAVSGGAVTITDQGIEMWSDTEQFSLYDTTLSGDGSITCRIASQTNTDPWAKAGVMIRSADVVGAAYAALCTSPGYGISVNDRAGVGLDTTYEPLPAVAPLPPCWLRLERVGTDVRSYTSPDGVQWTLANETTVGFGAQVRVGLFVLAHETAVPCTAVFDHITVEQAATQSDLTLLALTQQYVLGLDRSLPDVILTDTTYDAAGQLIARQDGRGILSTTTFDAQGRVAQRTAAAGTALAATTSNGYDAVGNVLTRTDALGRVSVRQYSARNLLLSQTDAAGLPEATITTHTYTLTQQLETTTTPLGTTTFTYAACCDRLVGATDEAGFTVRYTYDPNGNQTSITDGNGNTTVLAYDARNRVVASTNAAGETTTTAYADGVNIGTGISVAFASALQDLPLGPGADGAAALVTDPLGHATLTVSDGVGRTVRVIDPLGHATTTTYDQMEQGLVATTQQDALGDAMRQLRDGHQRLRQAIDAQGFRTVLAYDADDNRVRLRDPNGVGEDDTFDALNRAVARRDTVGATTQQGFDLLGNLLTETDAAGHMTIHVYDGLNRRTRTTNRIGATTLFAYDGVGNLRSVTDAQGGTTSYTFDARSLLVREVYPGAAGGVCTYAYDGGRRLVQRLDQTGRVTTYTYDRANRLTARAYPDHADDAYHYDLAGRLVEAISGRYHNTVLRVWDAAGHLTDEALVVVADPLLHSTVRYDVFASYDAADRLTVLTYPDGTASHRRYTARNQLAGVTYRQTSVASRSYDPGGRVRTTTLGNALQETRTYRLDNLVQRIRTPGVTDFTYLYDVTQRTLVEQDQVQPAQTQTFGYDAEGRVVNWQEGQGVGAHRQAWTLTPEGDWQQTVIDGVSQQRTHNAVHEITGINGQLLSSDPNGNLTQDPTQSLVLAWDPEDRLRHADHAGEPCSYSYDAIGRRIRTTVGQVTTTFVHAGAQAIWEVDTNESVYDRIAANGGQPTPERPLGGVLTGAGVTRIAFEPADAPVPEGFQADTGSQQAIHASGLTYGWVGAPQPYTHEYDIEPLPPFNGNDQMQVAGHADGTWQIQLPDGSYPVIVVMGDPAHRDMTNDVTVGTIPCQDPQPDAPNEAPGYEQGRFVGYAVQAQVHHGSLAITPRSSAVHARICFVEIGARGTALDPGSVDRLQQLVSRMTAATANVPPKRGTRAYVFGTYLDEPLAMVRAGVITYYHLNRVYSVACLTDAAGKVVERYRYSAYGQRTIDSSGSPVSSSRVANQLGFTGRYHDDETGLIYDRARYVDTRLGRFVSRDPKRYVDGNNLYFAYFIPNHVDPNGQQKFPVNCGTVDIEIDNGSDVAEPQITLSFTATPGVACCCTKFAWIQFQSPGADGPWRYDNGALSGDPQNGRGSFADPNGPENGENNRPAQPPPGSFTPWPNNPWYGGGDAHGKNLGGPPTAANPKPDATNPNPSDSIGDAPTVEAGLYFIDQLVCVDTGKRVWQYAWNNRRADGNGRGPITGNPLPLPAAPAAPAPGAPAPATNPGHGGNH